MTELSQYQTVFRVSKNFSRNNGTQSRGPKRNRAQISCLSCRSRKAKCDRQLPCSSCSERGDFTSCSYPSSALKTHDQNNAESKALDAKVRLQKLEQMVTSLMNTNKEAPKLFNNPVLVLETDDSSTHVSSPRSDTLVRHLDTQESEISYIGATHWSAILGDIRGIQKALESSPQVVEDNVTVVPSVTPDIVFNSSGYLKIEDVLKCLPPKAHADSLISSFFNDDHCFQLQIVHRGKFQREYQMFWADPTSMSFLWISILFSMLYMSGRFTSPGGSFSAEQPAHSVFFEKAGQALITGQYQKAQPYSVEAVFLHGLCKYFFKGDSQADAWMVVGISARLAIRMGYHRDPRHLAKVSPFEGEMRRRIFFTLEIFDLLFSLRAGLPPLIHEEDCDSASPRNLLDSDFDEDCQVLPPSRPITDPTPMLYYCYKSRLTRTFRRVIRHALSIDFPAYEQVMKLDSDLHKLQAEVPPSLKNRPLSASTIDKHSVIMNRINIEVMYQQSLCVLHRRYLSHDTLNPAYAYSRKACGDAALRLLELQRELHAVAKSGDVYDLKWIPSSLVVYSFLLGAMLVSLDLFESQNRPSVVSDDTETLNIKYDALRQSYDICVAMKNISQDVSRASHVLAVMLNKIRKPNVPNRNEESRILSERSSQNAIAEFETVSPLGCSANIPYLNSPESIIDTAPDLHLDSVFDDFETIDWNGLDQYLFGESQHTVERPWDLTN